jgi:hypothetical protein
MDGFRELQRLRPRQDASSGSVGSGESNTFLDLIANPFLAAVSFSSTQDYSYLSDFIVSSKCLLGISRYLTRRHCPACTGLLSLPPSTFPCLCAEDQTCRRKARSSFDRQRHLLMAETRAEDERRGSGGQNRIGCDHILAFH